MLLILKYMNKVLEALLNQKIVALFQGSSEAGPRALGNRSILFDPRVKNGKDMVNKVKKREYFRPFGCSVLLEKCHDWFEMDKLLESPFMMYAVPCRKNKVFKIPSVLHVDNTCRLQTVTENQNKILYWLLKDFNQKTNVPMLLNTSFNLAGEPLVQTKKDALQTFEKSKIDLLWIVGDDIYAK